MWLPTLPGITTCLWMAPLVAAYVVAAGVLCGWLKARRGMRTGDTRKIFHFAIFTAAALLSHRFGIDAVNLLGGIAGLYVLAVLRLGPGNSLYEAMARETDAPRRSLHVVLPFVATALGGMVSTTLFGRLAIVGFAVSGCADAIAEPIGIRFGRHRYRVPSLCAGVRSERSIEGSAAVLVAAFLAAAIALWIETSEPPRAAQGILAAAAAICAVSAVVEALSPHGLDNLTLQLAASGTAWALQ